MSTTIEEFEMLVRAGHMTKRVDPETGKSIYESTPAGWQGFLRDKGPPN